MSIAHPCLVLGPRLASDLHLISHRKPQELINVPAARDSGIQVIKRFSGGGTVVTDENTIFATVILQTVALPPHVECYPRPLMRWSESLYAPTFSPYGHFNLQENGEKARLHALYPAQHLPNVKMLEALLRFPCHCATSQHDNICHHQLSDDEGLCYTQLLRQRYDIAPTSKNSGCVICLWASLSFEPDLSVVQFLHSKMPAMTACMQITVLGMSSLGAMRRPSPSSDFCITHLSCGTTKVSACGC